jgi:predicted GNAT family N-acyltransferase
MTQDSDIQVGLANTEALRQLIYKLRDDVFIKEQKYELENEVDE